jgi:hypothetical protein
MQQPPVELERFNYDRAINNEEERYVKRITQSRRFFSLLPPTFKACMLKGLLYGVLLLFVIGTLYCVVSLQLFYNRVDQFIDHDEYDKAIE